MGPPKALLLYVLEKRVVVACGVLGSVENTLLLTLLFSRTLTSLVYLLALAYTVGHDSFLDWKMFES